MLLDRLNLSILSRFWSDHIGTQSDFPKVSLAERCNEMLIDPDLMHTKSVQQNLCKYYLLTSAKMDFKMKAHPWKCSNTQ